MNRIFFILIAILLIGCNKNNEPFTTVLFENGTGDYNCYRIPAIVKTNEGTILAFIEGRKADCADYGNVDLLMRSSIDAGVSWSEPVVVVDHGTIQAGNPAPVMDLSDPDYPMGRLFLFFNTGTASEQQVRLGKGERRVAYITSIDEGKSWSEPVDITSQVHFNVSTGINSKDWRTHANTPGHALQLQKGIYKGRIYIPANHSMGNPQENFNEYRSYGYYSDDHGQNWQVSEDVPVISSNEAIGVELPDGTLMLNIREQNGNTKRRLVALSSDGGEHWNNTYFDNALISPVCQSSILYFEHIKRPFLVYSGPHSESKREKMTLHFSFDYGASWPFNYEVFSGASAYSDLVQIERNSLGLLFEEVDQRIIFVKINPVAILPD